MAKRLERSAPKLAKGSQIGGDPPGGIHVSGSPLATNLRCVQITHTLPRWAIAGKKTGEGVTATITTALPGCATVAYDEWEGDEIEF